MFDNLRDLADDNLYEEDQKQDTRFEEAGEIETPVFKPAPKKRRQGNFLGMTAPQRFVLSVMLMFTVLLLGMLAMFVFGKMSIAF